LLKGGPQVSPVVVGVGIFVVVVIAGWFIWSNTGKRQVVVQDREAFKAAYEKAKGNQPDSPSGPSGGPDRNKMQDAINRARMGGRGSSGGPGQ
jgi:hypothetical protein